MPGKRAVIFCSASFEIDPKYNEAARQVVRAVCSHNYGIVSGGTTKGTMKVVSDEAAALGAEHIGVLPRFMEQYRYPALTELKWTDTMSERKEKMREGTCLAIALPGGIGTMDELFETFTLAKLGVYKGKVIALNYEGFYDKLKDFLDYLTSTGMLDGHTRQMISFPETVEELEKLL